MRQICVLVVGLMLIFCWASLVRVLRSGSKESPQIAQASEAPAPIPQSRVQPIPISRRGQVFPQAPADAGVVHATYAPMAVAVSTVKITAVHEISTLLKNESDLDYDEILWPEDSLKHGVFLTGKDIRVATASGTSPKLGMYRKINGKWELEGQVTASLEFEVPSGTSDIVFTVDGLKPTNIAADTIIKIHVPESREAFNFTDYQPLKHSPWFKLQDLAQQSISLSQKPAKQEFTFRLPRQSSDMQFVRYLERANSLIVVSCERIVTRAVTEDTTVEMVSARADVTSGANAGNTIADKQILVPFSRDSRTQLVQRGRPVVLKKGSQIDENIKLSLTYASPGILTVGTTDPVVTTVLEKVARPEAYVVAKIGSQTQAVPVSVTTLVPPDDTGRGAKLIRFEFPKLANGTYLASAQLYVGSLPLNALASETVEVQKGGFRITNVGPTDFGYALGSKTIRIDFSRAVAESVDAKDPTSGHVQVVTNAAGEFALPAKATVTSQVSGEAKFSDDRRSLYIPFTAPAAGVHRLTINGSLFADAHGNKLEGDDGVPGSQVVRMLGRPTDAVFDPRTRGVVNSRAPHVEYPEFVAPQTPTKGFNPSDKVETRVARLYFYRDAHRVAQILNRRAESYNRQGVTARQQMADKSRQESERVGTLRLNAERHAIQKAQQTRQLERDLSDAQRALDRSLQELQNASLRANTTDPTAGSDAQQAAAQAAIARDQQVIDQLENTVRSFAARAQTLETEVRNARDAEGEANEQWQQLQREEQLARTDQFRLETAAAHEDPDTFAAGNLKSIDPVAQVSISVIGEGLLHLRGPLKGVNRVRLMIDQIDAPQGQVRVSVHSTQINGDEADHLEVVANRIQSYIDQARFLTTQSGEIFRKSVVHVAAARAEQARAMYPGATQADRDQLYLHAFFGSDFVNELRAMNSELLHTGNKLLALHSMDVTSLSSALTLLALASNETRLQILDEFQQQLETYLPAAEAEYIRNGIGCCTGGCRQGCKHHKKAPPICQFSQNATFTSLRGFFDAQLAGDSTISPMQREMIRLAQILKARMVTEMEYKQRVMERAVIEERSGETGTAADQVRREREALFQLETAMKAQRSARATLVASIPNTTSELDAALASYGAITKEVKVFSHFVDAIIDLPDTDGSTGPETNADKLYALLSVIDATRQWRWQQYCGLGPDENVLQSLGVENVAGTNLNVHLFANRASDLTSDGFDGRVYIVSEVNQRAGMVSQLNQILTSLKRAQDTLRPFNTDSKKITEDIDELLSGLEDTLNGSLPILKTDRGDLVPVISVAELRKALIRIAGLLVRYQTTNATLVETRRLRLEFEDQFYAFMENSRSGDVKLKDLAGLLRSWNHFRTALRSVYHTSFQPTVESAVSSTSQALEKLSNAMSELDAAQSFASESRRPLDHKKFLDMLIDDLEEKHIELLEGTRAHTANIDNYLKRLTTALDDDFNRQFYNPAFRLVREASQFKRVEFGQTETTSVLANNRSFAKVSPSATMEFDLPKRDILIKEGLDSALAIYNDVGALVNDPNLLALAKMGSGQSVASPAAGSLGGFGAIRNVIPGLQSESAEQIMARNAGSGPEFESSVEKLIPDPAVYKFETGTGYEIRPVIAPDGQAVVFDFHYLYTTQIREPVRADEKHLGRVKQHLIDTDVQLSNFELREVSRYTVALKAERTANGVPLLEDIPLIGVLWRPLPNREKSLQQNIVMAQATIFPTLFDLMGLRWAQTVADVDPLHLSNREYLVRGRHQYLENRIYDYSSNQVDEFLRIPEDNRRADLYRSQATIPKMHPNGYQGPGLDRSVSSMREGYSPAANDTGMIPSRRPDGSVTNQPGSGYSGYGQQTVPQGMHQSGPPAIPQTSPPHDGLPLEMSPHSSSQSNNLRGPGAMQFSRPGAVEEVTPIRLEHNLVDGHRQGELPAPWTNPNRAKISHPQHPN